MGMHTASHVGTGGAHTIGMAHETCPNPPHPITYVSRRCSGNTHVVSLWYDQQISAEDLAEVILYLSSTGEISARAELISSATRETVLSVEGHPTQVCAWILWSVSADLVGIRSAAMREREKIA